MASGAPPRSEEPLLQMLINIPKDPPPCLPKLIGSFGAIGPFSDEVRGVRDGKETVARGGEERKRRGEQSASCGFIRVVVCVHGCVCVYVCVCVCVVVVVVVVVVCVHLCVFVSVYHV
jgi:hypothetical protein